jgi:hypothetical protein
VIRRCPEVRRLTTLPGVSTVLGYTIAAEIGRLDRFKSGRDLASYSILTPLSDDSGDERDGPPIGRHVGKAGRRTLKWAWIEAARNAVKKSLRMKGVFDRYTDNGKYNRGRGYIVVAHQLCLIGYAMWKKQTDYQETPPPRPGQTSLNSVGPQKTEARQPAGIQPAADEFCALAATGREVAHTHFKESDEQTTLKKRKRFFSSGNAPAPDAIWPRESRIGLTAGSGTSDETEV